MFHAHPPCSNFAHSPQITITGSEDGRGIAETSYSKELSTTVHVEWNSENGRPAFVQMYGVDVVIVLGYDDAGNLVDVVEETGG